MPSSAIAAATSARVMEPSLIIFDVADISDLADFIDNQRQQQQQRKTRAVVVSIEPSSSSTTQLQVSNYGADTNVFPAQHLLSAISESTAAAAAEKSPRASFASDSTLIDAVRAATPCVAPAAVIRRGVCHSKVNDRVAAKQRK